MFKDQNFLHGKIAVTAIAEPDSRGMVPVITPDGRYKVVNKIHLKSLNGGKLSCWIKGGYVILRMDFPAFGDKEALYDIMKLDSFQVEKLTKELVKNKQMRDVLVDVVERDGLISSLVLEVGKEGRRIIKTLLAQHHDESPRIAALCDLLSNTEEPKEPLNQEELLWCLEAVSGFINQYETGVETPEIKKMKEVQQHLKELINPQVDIRA